MDERRTLERQRRALDIAAEVLLLAPEQRALAVTARCADDPHLADEVAGLCSHAARPLDLFGHVGETAVDITRDGVLGVEEARNSTPGGGAAAPTVPHRLGRYRLVRCLGEGGTGRVFEAEDDESPQRVAIKVLVRAGASDRSCRRFRQEGQILAGLDHPGIAKVVDSAVFDTPFGPLPYLVMELVNGPSIAEYMAARRLPLRARVEMFCRTCEAVEYLRLQGIVHRDLKPANILVGPDGQPRLVDFGVASGRPLAGTLTEPVTEESQFLGTLAYMSPEQLGSLGDGHADERAEVYALGVILYELLTGRHPRDFEGVPLFEALSRVVEEDPEPPSSLNPEIPASLERLAMAAMARKRSDRPASAGALAEGLRTILATGWPAGHRGAATRGFRRLARTRLTRPVARLVMTLAVVLAIAAAWHAGRSSGVAGAVPSQTTLRTGE